MEPTPAFSAWRKNQLPSFKIPGEGPAFSKAHRTLKTIHLLSETPKNGVWGIWKSATDLSSNLDGNLCLLAIDGRKAS